MTTAADDQTSSSVAKSLTSPSGWTLPVLVALGLTVAQLVLLVVAVWPVVRTAPREVPIAVAGPAPAIAMLERRIEAAAPGAFSFRQATDEGATRKMIKNGEVYGAIVIGQGGPRVLTSSAASPAATSVLDQMAARMSPAPVHVDDVVTAPPNDPQKAGLLSTLVVLFFIAIVVGAVLALRVGTMGRRWAGLGLFVVASAPLSVALLHGWLGVLDGSYVGVTLVVAFASLAGALAGMGATMLLGPAGTGLSVFLFIQFAPSIAAVSTGTKMVPPPLDTIGSLLPPGAFVALLQSVTSFGGHGVMRPVVVLLVWCAAGAMMALAAAQLKPLPARMARTEGIRGDEAQASTA